MAVDDNTRDDVKLAVIQNDLTYIKEKLNAVDTKVSLNYVSKDEFEPVRKIVYTLVGLFLTSIVGGLMVLLIGSK
jgi:hypothetical protein